MFNNVKDILFLCTSSVIPTKSVVKSKYLNLSKHNESDYHYPTLPYHSKTNIY